MSSESKGVEVGGGIKSTVVQGVEVRQVSWRNIDNMCALLVKHLEDEHGDLTRKFNRIVGIPRGGLIPGVIISHLTGLWFQAYPSFCLHPRTPTDVFPSESTKASLVVDDICDSGETFKIAREWYVHSHFVSLFVKPDGLLFRDASVLEVPQNTWIQMPWETPVSSTEQPQSWSINKRKRRRYSESE